MAEPRPSGSTAAGTDRQGLAAAAFELLAGRLADRAQVVALFTETGVSYQPWCVWEAVAAFRGAGWTTRPRPRYADIGVAGSREQADLWLFDPRQGGRVLLELAVVHDWSTNRWIAELDAGTARLRKAAATGAVPLQVVAAASLEAPIELHPRGGGWLAMSEVWKRPTDLERKVALGAVGELLLRGWIVGEPGAGG